MPNLLLETPEYRIDQTRRGTWRRYLYPTGQRYAEFTSHARLFGLPLLHYTFGICPETGGRKIARGFFALGRIAMGVFPVGQVAIGFLPLGQASFGLLALGQGAIGLVAVGQAAFGAAFALGQIAIGWIAIGQLAVGHYALAQVALATHGWSPKVADPEAVHFFRQLLGR